MNHLSIRLPLCDIAYSPFRDGNLLIILGGVCALGVVALFFFIRRKKK